MTQHDAEGSALVLAGGGARAAYQVGVLRAIAEILPDHSPNPFRILCGTSAGAINAAALAASAADFRQGVTHLQNVWGRLAVRDVYHTDAMHLLRRFGGWMLPFLFPAGGRTALGILDNAPLADLLGRRIDFRGVQAALTAGHLDALTVTASNYRTRMSVSFCAVPNGTPLWKRAQRVGIAA